METLLGIETAVLGGLGRAAIYRNQLETLLGIETGLGLSSNFSIAHRNQLETLLGIETTRRGAKHCQTQIEINWKPF